MKADVRSLDDKKVGTVDLPEAIFGLEPRRDILQRMVVYQLAKRRAGTHKSQTRAEVSATGQKIYRQKGTGRARHSSRRANIFRGGGKAFGPEPRDHSIALPKKVRALALKHALSAKARSDELIVLDKASVDEAKTGQLKNRFAKLGLDHALIVDGKELDRNFALAARNLVNIDVLPVQGINVYDILRRRKLVLTRAALEALEARFQ